MSKRHILIPLVAAVALAFAGSALAEQHETGTDAEAQKQKQQQEQQTQERDAQQAQPGEGGDPMQQPDAARGASEGTPRATRAAAPIGQGEQYVVQQGDTLSKLAQRFLGSSDQWQQIASANQIEDPKALRVGQRLTIPGASASGAEPTGTQQPSQRNPSEERMQQPGGARPGGEAGGAGMDQP
jgi:nucleoid-associated protein YgaU